MQCMDQQMNNLEHPSDLDIKKKYRFAGKTGTSQVKRITDQDRELDLDLEEIEYKSRDHALFIAFAPYDKPRYSLSVLIEHGGSGSKAAAPLANKLIKKILDRDELREKKRKDLKNINDTFNVFKFYKLFFFDKLKSVDYFLIIIVL